MACSNKYVVIIRFTILVVTLSLQKEDAYILDEFNKITNNQNTIKFGKGRHSNMAEAHFKNYDIAKKIQRDIQIFQGKLRRI